MVTRTITTTTVDAFCIDKATRETFTETVVLSGKCTDTKKLDKIVSKMINSDFVRFIYADNVRVEESRYGISEEDFIKYGFKLDGDVKESEETESEETEDVED